MYSSEETSARLSNSCLTDWIKFIILVSRLPQSLNIASLTVLEVVKGPGVNNKPSFSSKKTQFLIGLENKKCCLKRYSKQIGNQKKQSILIACAFSF